MKNKQLKVLHIMSGFGGGISSFIRNKAEYMVNKNIRFDVVTYDEYPLNFKNAIYNTGGEVYTLQNPKTTSWKAFKQSYTSVLKQNEYDIIYCHINGYRILPYYYYARKMTNANFYVHAHTSHYPKHMLAKTEQLRIGIDQLINRKVTDKFIGCGSLSIRNIFGSNVEKEEMVVIPNSVEVERFIKDKTTSQKLRNQYREDYKLEEDELVIGHIGRLTKIKNHKLTINLANYIKNNNLRIKILIIGEGYHEVELKKLVEMKDLNNIITFTGRISPIEDFFPALDVMILPSFAEGLPTTVVEAQASGVPVVMSDTITEEVDLGFNMLETVSIENDISKWIEAVKNTQTVIIPDKEVREEVIKEKGFSNDASAKLYIDFLRGKLNQYTID
jgi:glycosyltransferase involved in cell wall biosynthesis